VCDDFTYRMEHATWRGRALAAALLLLAAPGWIQGAEFTITPEIRSALDNISANSLRGHVSFLASDLLEGRGTPSHGLDIAAEYIASQFRAAGLEPGGDDGYFETAKFVSVKPSYEDLEMVVETSGEPIRVPAEHAELGRALTGLQLRQAPLVKIRMADLGDRSQWTPERVRDKVILTEAADESDYDLIQRFRRNLAKLQPLAAIVLVRRQTWHDLTTALADPGDPEAKTPRIIRVHDGALRKVYREMKTGETGARVSLTIAAPSQQPVTLRNVVGILRGSDPVLKSTYVLVTAHYDHLGVCSTGADRICNGANDDASGAASVIELASALARLRERPKRSLVFVTFFGEEEGLYGSRYYIRHPAVPLDETVADLNLEQLGRTDDSDGPQKGRATLTGFEYTDIGPTLVKAGELTGVVVADSGERSDAFFARSDNQSFADAGVPANTLLVAYEFPDYHQPGDEWQKLDYANMEKIDRMIAVGLLMIAGNPVPPKWIETNPKAGQYVRVWKERRGS
jgi:hypothetical protein